MYLIVKISVFKLIALPIYNVIWDFQGPKALNFDAIYLKKETYFVKHCRKENVSIGDSN